MVEKYYLCQLMFPKLHFFSPTIVYYLVIVPRPTNPDTDKAEILGVSTLLI